MPSEERAIKRISIQTYCGARRKAVRRADQQKLSSVAKRRHLRTKPVALAILREASNAAGERFGGTPRLRRAFHHAINPESLRCSVLLERALRRGLTPGALTIFGGRPTLEPKLLRFIFSQPLPLLQSVKQKSLALTDRTVNLGRTNGLPAGGPNFKQGGYP
jgi:hypothetical protein